MGREYGLNIISLSLWIFSDNFTVTNLLLLQVDIFPIFLLSIFHSKMLFNMEKTLLHINRQDEAWLVNEMHNIHFRFS